MITLDELAGSVPNIAPRPNVAPRNSALNFTDDRRFLRSIRGRRAVLQLLKALGYSPSIRASDPTALALKARGVLSDAHLFYLEEDSECTNCSRNPVGIDFSGRRAFRCDRPGCQ